MPVQMRRLGAVQFFSWLAFFSMWSMATPGLTEHVFKAPAPNPAAFDMANATQAAAFQSANAAFQDAADLVGSYMGYYGLSSMLVALLLSFIAARRPLNRKAVHAVSLVLGGIGFLSMWAVPNPAGRRAWSAMCSPTAATSSAGSQWRGSSCSSPASTSGTGRA